MRVLSLVVVLLCTLVLAPSAQAKGGHARLLIRKVNVLRAEHGLPPVRASRTLVRSSRSWARRIARTGNFRHASMDRARRRFRHFGEVIEWHPGRRAKPEVTFRTWAGSAHHRSILLNRKLRWIGLARAVGQVNGRRTTIWVGRLGGR